MSRWADWFGMTPEDANELYNASRSEDDPDGSVYKLLEPWIERAGELEDLPLHVTMDKVWEPIHRCLTEDHGAAYDLDFDAGEYPLNLCVLGGKQLLQTRGQTAALISPKDVPIVAAALAVIDKDWLRQRFFAIPDTQFHDISEDHFEWVWAHFEDLPPFFAKAAAEGCAVVCTISH